MEVGPGYSVLESSKGWPFQWKKFANPHSLQVVVADRTKCRRVLLAVCVEGEICPSTWRSLTNRCSSSSSAPAPRNVPPDSPFASCDLTRRSRRRRIDGGPWAEHGLGSTRSISRLSDRLLLVLPNQFINHLPTPIGQQDEHTQNERMSRSGRYAHNAQPRSQYSTHRRTVSQLRGFGER